MAGVENELMGERIPTDKAALERQLAEYRTKSVEDLAPALVNAERRAEEALERLQKWDRELGETRTRARTAEDTVKSIATMLGWGNVPPRETLERDLRAKRAAYEFEREGRLKAEARVKELEGATK